MTLEVWKTVPSLPDYEASSLGRVRRKPFYGEMPRGGKRMYGGQETEGCIRKDKNRRFILYKGKNYAVHRLVCEAFHGVAPGPYPDYVCVHLDENCLNNKAENLAWASQKENLNAPKYKSRIGKVRAGKTTKKIPDEDIDYIRSCDKTNVDLANIYGVAACTISNIRNYRSRA